MLLGYAVVLDYVITCLWLVLVVVVAVEVMSKVTKILQDGRPLFDGESELAWQLSRLIETKSEAGGGS